MDLGLQLVITSIDSDLAAPNVFAPQEVILTLHDEVKRVGYLRCLLGGSDYKPFIQPISRRYHFARALASDESKDQS
jgi:hypothetical protein